MKLGRFLGWYYGELKRRNGDDTPARIIIGKDTRRSSYMFEYVRVTDKKAAQDDADVQAAVKKVTEELGDTGRILVRESGTEPVVRVMVEAESEEICQKYVDMVVNVIKENGYVAG